MRKIILIVFCFYISCGVKQPIDPSDQTSVGHIIVTSGEVSGSIILDNQDTNKSTPDTLFNILTGLHSVRVVREGYKSIPDSIHIRVENDKYITAAFEFEQFSQIGFVRVATTPSRAQIYVDGLITGKYTPDTLQLETGVYEISAMKNGYVPLVRQVTLIQDSTMIVEDTLDIKQRVLLESFGNVSCAPCVDAARNLDSFYENENQDNFVILEYFANWPNPNDPFYLVAPQSVDARVNYYQVMGLPDLRLNGVNEVDPTIYENMVSTFQQAYAAQQSSIGISVESNFSDGELIISVEVYSFEGSLAEVDHRLFVAVIENEIHFDEPPGSNGLTDFNFVFRNFLYSEYGDPIQSESNIKNFDYRINWSNWNYNNSEIVAFIQDYSSKRIIQSSKKKLGL